MSSQPPSAGPRALWTTPTGVPFSKPRYQVHRSCFHRATFAFVCLGVQLSPRRSNEIEAETTRGGPLILETSPINLVPPGNATLPPTVRGRLGRSPGWGDATRET
eukprot:1193446-Prorocentrum_minimum.AAC.2